MAASPLSLGQRKAIHYCTWLLLFLLGGLALLSGCSQSQPNPLKTGGAKLSLGQQTYDFGQISANQKVLKELEFTNTGTQPLTIKDVLPIAPPGG